VRTDYGKTLPCRLGITLQASGLIVMVTNTALWSRVERQQFPCSAGGGGVSDLTQAVTWTVGTRCSRIGYFLQSSEFATPSSIIVAESKKKGHRGLKKETWCDDVWLIMNCDIFNSDIL
jgi:hypothetical protein